MPITVIPLKSRTEGVGGANCRRTANPKRTLTGKAKGLPSQSQSPFGKQRATSPKGLTEIAFIATF